jgi:hypothetical protein
MADEAEYLIEGITAAEVAADELHDKKEPPSTLVKDPNEIKKLEFVLNIQEVPGKKISENYVKDLTEKLNAIKQQRTYVQFNIRMVVESDIKYGKMMGGDGSESSTFPYNIFESAFDIISGKNRNTLSSITDDTNKNNQVIASPSENVNASDNVNLKSNNKSIFDGLFSFAKLNSSSSPPDSETSFTMPRDLENLVQEPINYVDDYDGVTHVLVTIYDKTDSMGYIGGVIQLENWIK